MEKCGIQNRLKSFGISKNDLPELARQAMSVTRLLKNNPRLINEEDALEIYKSAY
jgi:alcohol dehydrogenase class IV